MVFSLYKKAVPIFQQLEVLIEDTKESLQDLKGEVRVGSLTEVGQARVFPVLMQFKTKHEFLTLYTEYLQERHIVRKVLDGELDVGIVTQSSSVVPKCIGVKLFQEEICLVTRRQNLPDDPPANLDLTAIPLVCYRKEDPLLKAFCKSFREKVSLSQLTLRVIVNSHHSMREALINGDLWAVLPKHSVAQLLSEGVLVNVEEHNLKSFIYAIYLRKNLRQKSLRRLINHIKLNLSESLSE